VPNAAAFDAPRIFETLHRHGVRSIVIGGLAAAAGGVVWTTFDADVIVDSSAKNLDALAQALDELSAEYDTQHSPPIRPDASRLRSLPGPQLFRTRFGRLDVLKDAGDDTFESLAPDAGTADLGGTLVLYASLTALLRMKRAANRPKDREGIRLLERALHDRKT
jgi:hypothetical protein